jgi:hypothetical protein
MEANISLVWSHWVGVIPRRNSLIFRRGPDDRVGASLVVATVVLAFAHRLIIVHSSGLAAQ